MKKFWATGFLATALLLAAVAHAEGLWYNDQRYVPIAGWAHAEGYQCRWLQPGHTYQATGRTTRLVFKVNSVYADLNGVEVALSFPVADHRGTALAAQFDLDHTVRPLLYPSRYETSHRIATICLDPGHGGRDTGNIFRWHDEKKYTLLLAFDLREALRRDGFRVLLTRHKDVYVSLPARCAYANRHHADLFVSLHFNATRTDRDQVKGPETYCITPVGASSTNAHGEGSDHGPTVGNRCENNSLLLAYEVEKSLVQTLHLDDRGVRRARFAVLRGAKMPAILVESGYMTNPTEGKKIFTPAYRHALARAIAKGIVAYQKLTAP